MNIKQFVQSSVAVIITVFLVLSFTPLAHAKATVSGPGGTIVEGFVERLNVSNLHEAIPFYQDKLGMELEFETPKFAQLYYRQGSSDPDVSNTRIGLSEGISNGSNKATTTIFVSDIMPAYTALVAKGIEFLKNKQGDEICSAGPTISLAFFCDPYNNSLALGEEHPSSGPDVDNCPSPQCPVS